MLAAVAGHAAAGGTGAWTFSTAGLLLVLAGLVFGRSQPVLWGIGVVAASYVGSLYSRGAAFDTWSVLVAVALLASGELAHWSIDSRIRSLDEVRVHARRARSTAAALAIGLGAAAIVEGAAAVGSGGVAAAITATAALLIGLAVIVTALLRQSV